MACKEVTAPADNIFLITPNNDSDLGQLTRGIAFAAAGTLRVTTVANEDVTIPDGALAAGIIHPIRVRKVWATGTSATGIVGFA